MASVLPQARNAVLSMVTASVDGSAQLGEDPGNLIT
jgi:hypothetical protein